MNDRFSSRSLPLFQPIWWMQSCRALIFLGLSFYPFGIGHAVTYVVSPSGNDTSTNGDLSTPFSTIEKALSVAQPGDSVQLRAGTYREAINPPRSGTAQNPIVIEAYPGESVTVSALDEVTLGQRRAMEFTPPPFRALYRSLFGVRPVLHPLVPSSWRMAENWTERWSMKQARRQNR